MQTVSVEDEEKGDKEVSAPKRRKRLHAIPLPFVLYSPMLAEMLLGSITPKAIAALDQEQQELMAEKAIDSGAFNAKVLAADLRVCLRAFFIILSDSCMHFAAHRQPRSLTRLSSDPDLQPRAPAELSTPTRVSRVPPVLESRCVRRTRSRHQ
jgi:hypothetical protein